MIANIEALQKAKNTFNAALYVISQPFNFVNKNMLIKHIGAVDLVNNKAHEIKVGYVIETGDSEKWFYYFDVTNFKMIGNKVLLKDHASFVENNTFDTTTSFIFNQSKKSYRLNDAGEKTYVSATYFYDNFKLNFNKKV